jgi:sugar O-acyltransferase (sialic acid O-acetyltransferase NeuD family)
MEKIVLFGIRSPLLPDYEEICSRLELQIAAAVRADSRRPRILDRRAIIDLSDLDERQQNFPFVACAFYPKRRSELAAMAGEAGLIATEALIDPSAIIASSTRVGNGGFISAGVVVGAAGVFGEHVYVNRSTNIGHHVFFDDFVAIGPGVTIAGNVHIGEHSLVGAGSIILPGVRIGKSAVVAAGSVVRHHISDEALVAGNPARVKRRQPGAGIYGVEGEE